MKIKILNLILIVAIASCSINNKIVNTKKYICPEIKVNENLIYEYECSNKDIEGFKYLIISRKNNEDGNNYVQYIFYDSLLNGKSGMVEERMKNETQIKEVIVFEQNLDGKELINNILLEKNLSVSFKMDNNWRGNYTYSWKSKQDPSVEYFMEIERKLGEKVNNYIYKNKAYKGLKFYEQTKMTIKNNGVEINEFSYAGESIYIDKIGIANMKMILSENQVQEIKLKEVYIENEFKEIRNKILEKKKKRI